MKNPCDKCLVQPMCVSMCEKAKSYYVENEVQANPNYREVRKDDQYVEYWTTTSNMKYVIEKPINSDAPPNPDQYADITGRVSEEDQEEVILEDNNTNEIKEIEQCQIQQITRKSNTLKDSTSVFSRLTVLKPLLKKIFKTPLLHGKKDIM